MKLHALVFTLGLTSAIAAQPQWRMGNVTAKHDIEYGKPQLLDLYLPRAANGKLPLVVWIHGGGWKSGSKENFRPAQPLLNEGFAVASINYRLSGEAKFPAQIDDCKAAIRYLRAHAAEYGIDPARIGVFGSSAGGHLVALLGTSGSGTDGVQAVCDFYGPTDLIAMAKVPGYERHASPQSAESELLGGPAEQHPEIAKQANPITFIGKDTPPFLILHGSADPIVPPQQSQLLHDALRKAGIESSLHFLPGAKHGGPEFMAPDVQKIVAEFFAKHLKD